MATVFKVFIDINDDSSFSEEYTEFASEIDWKIGFDDDVQAVAPLSKARVVLENVVTHSLNLVDNPGFDSDVDWNKGPGWSIADGVAKAVNVSANLSQGSVVEVDKFYLTGFTVLDLVLGGFRFLCGGGPAPGRGTDRFSDGKYSEVLQATVGTTIFIQRIGVTTGNVDDVFCFEIIDRLDPEDLVNHGILIKAEHGAGPTIRNMFLGMVRDITIQGDGSEMVLNCVGMEEPLYSQRVSVPIQVDQRAPVILNQIMDQVQFRLTVLEDILILDDAVQGFLGKKLGAFFYPTDFDDGQEVFPYAGDAWDQILAIDAIRDVVGSESGRFFIGRAGTAVFRDRVGLITGSGNSITDVSAVDMKSIAGARRFNAVQVNWAGRAVGAPGSVLFSIDEPILIRRDQVRNITVRFRDASDNAIGALEIVELVASVDWFANRDGTTTTDSHTVNMRVDMIERNAGGVKLAVYHDRNFDLFLGKLQVRGTPLAKSNPTTTEVIDWRFATRDGIRYVTLEAPLLADIELAENVANTELARRSVALTVYGWVDCTEELSDLLVGISVLDEIEMSPPAEHGPAISATIFGEEHFVDADGIHKVRLLLGYGWGYAAVYGDVDADYDADGVVFG